MAASDVKQTGGQGAQGARDEQATQATQATQQAAGGTQSGGGHLRQLRIFARLIRKLVAPRKARFAFTVCCILFSTLVIVVQILYTRVLVDRFIMPMLSSGSRDFSTLYRLTLWYCGLLVIGFLANLGYTRMMAVIGQEFQRDIREEMFDHLQTLPLSYFDRHSFGEVMSHYTNDTDTLRQLISSAIPAMVQSGLVMICAVTGMLLVNAWLACVVIAVVVFEFFLMRWLIGRSVRYFKRQQSAIARMNGYVEEMLSGLKVVKVFNHEADALHDFGDVNDEFAGAWNKANSNANVAQPITADFGHLLYVLVVLVGALLMFGGVGGVTVGIITSFIQFVRLMTNNINTFTVQTNFVIAAMAGSERIFAHLDEVSEADAGTIRLVDAECDADGTWHRADTHTGRWAWQDGEALIPLQGRIRLQDVDFAYNRDRCILHQVCITAEPGQKVAIIGATGSGKTTITNLINRFYDIQAGQITYDGIDIARIRKPDLRRSLGVVLQDTSLFTGTVYDNIRYGRLDATDEEVEAAARLVKADAFISSMAQGYDTEISGDNDLSQGQRQLICIARAALTDPPVMVLDEATSSIDTRTEALVQEGMDALMRGRTVFVVAHRLSTIVNSDIILVMDKGRIIERGSHDELMASEGRYWQLYTGKYDIT
ncbi:MAG: ABC transporter ATP-binding protein/permease [Actinomycetes bacterium]|jgi:ATP-binding cassette subfamily B protein|nr:ABC transporter ATP-binding protein/permease [Actinomycetes bacterium]